MRRRKSQRGSILIEFSLAGVATVTMLIATVQMSIGLWHYHTLAYAVHEATRYVTAHGRGCTTGSTTCSITVADIAARLASDATGMATSEMNVTLTTNSGAVTNCNPLSTCSGNTTRWPPTSNLDNVAGKNVTIAASYTFRHTMLVFWPGSSPQRFAAFVFPASSTETIVF
jgi:Flp pilus assembly protein TadG